MNTNTEIMDGMASGQVMISLYMNAVRLAGQVNEADVLQNIQSLETMRRQDKILSISTAKLISYCAPYLIFMIATNYKNTIPVLNEALDAELIIDDMPNDHVKSFRQIMTANQPQQKERRIIMGETEMPYSIMAKLTAICHAVFKKCADVGTIPQNVYMIENGVRNKTISNILSHPIHIIRMFEKNHIFRKEIDTLIMSFKADYKV